MKFRSLSVFFVFIMLPLLSMASDLPTSVLLSWEDLIPEDFDLYSEQEKLLKPYDLEELVDGTELANEVLMKLQELSDRAPVVETLNGKTVKIPGFAVPLDYQETIDRFLFVPYFGACIHSPPPPSNQIILVQSPKPINLPMLEQALYITGVLTTQKITSELATSGYQMSLQVIEPYFNE